jgi:hypothetical protein
VRLSAERRPCDYWRAESTFQVPPTTYHSKAVNAEPTPTTSAGKTPSFIAEDHTYRSRAGVD